MSSARVTSAGTYVEATGSGLRVTSAGAYVEATGSGLRVTSAGAYVEAARLQLRVTAAGAYVEAIAPFVTDTRSVLQWRAHVGPRWLPATDTHAYDWSALNVGDEFAPAADGTIRTDLEPGATSISFTGTSPLSTYGTGPGGAWIAGNAAGEAWEYVDWVSWNGQAAGPITSLTRETVDAEQTGHHTAGAAIRWWFPLSYNDGDLTVSRTADSNLSVVSWQGQTQGYKIPQAALRLGHIVVIEKRASRKPSGAWGAWTIAQVGWITEVRATDGVGADGQWQITVDSAAGLLATLKAPGVQVGPNNDARGGSASGSIQLACAYKEAMSGEFTAAAPDLSPSAAIDGDLKTLFITEKFLGATNKPGTGTDGYIDQLHIAPYTGQGSRNRWFQFVGPDIPSPGGFWSVRFLNIDGVYPTSSHFAWTSGRSWDIDEHGPAIVCEDKARFHEENPDVAGAAYEIIELPDDETEFSDGTSTGLDWWNSLDPDGGAICVTTGSGGHTAHQNIIWGSVTLADVSWSSGQKLWDDEHGYLPAVGAGQTIRRLWAEDPNTATGYSVGYPSMPGYYLDGERQQFSLERPGLGLVLTDTITDGSTPGTDDAGATLYISAGDSPSTNGLDASGTIQIGSEQITYSAKVSGGVTITARGANGTTAAAHNAGDAVLAIEAGLACDAWPLAKVEIARAAGMPAVHDLELYGSRLTLQPQMPDDADEGTGWTDDWDLLATVTGNTADTYTYTHAGSNKRYRWLLIVVHAMETDPYRLMINEFRSYSAGAAYDTGSYLASGTVADVAGKILTAVGIPAGAQLVAAGGDDTPSISGITTAPQLALQVLGDMADMTRCMVKVEPDSKIRVTLNPWFGGTPSATITWTRTTAIRYKPEWRNGRKVSQVKIAWTSLDGATTGTARYPATPDTFGDVVTLGPFVCLDQSAADAIAEKRYWYARLLSGATVELADVDWAVEPGVAGGVTWQLDSSMLAMARTYLLNGVDQRISGGKLETVVHGAQIVRELEY